MKKLVQALALFVLTSNTAFANTADQSFEAVMGAAWAAQLKQYPTFATSLGVRDYDELLSDPSLEAYEATTLLQQQFLDQLQEIDVSALSKDNQLNHELLKLLLESEVEAAKHGGKYMLMTNRGGPHLSLTSMVGRLPFFKLADYQSYVTRLGKMSEYLDRATSRLQAGLDAGWNQPCEPMQGFEKSIEVHVVENAEDSRFIAPFKNRPSVVAEKDFAKLQKKALSTIEESVVPAFAKFHDFYMNKVKPACRTEVGTNSMPGGDEYYAHRVKLYTTTDQTPDEILGVDVFFG